jgi:hypothetical protein
MKTFYTLISLFNYEKGFARYEFFDGLCQTGN